MGPGELRGPGGNREPQSLPASPMLLPRRCLLPPASGWCAGAGVGGGWRRGALGLTAPLLRREHAAEAHVGAGLDVRRPPLPHHQHLPVLASGARVREGALTRAWGQGTARLTVSLPCQVGQATRHAAAALVPEGQVQRLSRTVSLLSKDRTPSEKKTPSVGGIPRPRPRRGPRIPLGALRGRGTEGARNGRGDEDD